MSPQTRTRQNPIGSIEKGIQTGDRAAHGDHVRLAREDVRRLLEDEDRLRLLYPTLANEMRLEEVAVDLAFRTILHV